MGSVALEGFGGGGGAHAGLKIVGNPRPSNPKEGTVWVNTDTEITGYVLSATQPENPTQGMLWIKISDYSNIKVGTPLGKDYITIMLDSVSQYVGGAWVNVEALSFQNGVWNEFWNGTIISATIDKTGGWKWYNTGSGPSATRQADGSYKLNRPADTPGFLWMTNNAFDLTNVKTIKFDILQVGGTGNGVGIMKPDNTTATAPIAKTDTNTVGTGYTVDVSTYSGKYALACNVDAGYAMVIANVEMVR